MLDEGHTEVPSGHDQLSSSSRGAGVGGAGVGGVGPGATHDAAHAEAEETPVGPGLQTQLSLSQLHSGSGAGVGGHLAFTLASATHCPVHLCHVAVIRLGAAALSVTYM